MKDNPRSTLPLRAFVALLLAASMSLTSGCFLIAVGAAGAAGAGAVAYVRGELDASLSSPYESVVAATDRALQQLQFPKETEAKDGLAASIVARTALSKKVAITLNKVADNLTRVRIRVAVFGDEQISRTLLDKIKANL
jgi:hypothetical protein